MLARIRTYEALARQSSSSAGGRGGRGDPRPWRRSRRRGPVCVWTLEQPRRSGGSRADRARARSRARRRALRARRLSPSCSPRRCSAEAALGDRRAGVGAAGRDDEPSILMDQPFWPRQYWTWVDEPERAREALGELLERAARARRRELPSLPLSLARTRSRLRRRARTRGRVGPRRSRGGGAVGPAAVRRVQPRR